MEGGTFVRGSLRAAPSTPVVSLSPPGVTAPGPAWCFLLGTVPSPPRSLVINPPSPCGPGLCPPPLLQGPPNGHCS